MSIRLTAAQWDEARRHCRVHPDSKGGRAARLVMVEGISQRQAQREVGLASVRSVQQSIASVAAGHGRVGG